MVDALPKVESPVTESVPEMERLLGEKLVTTRSVKRPREANRDVEVAKVEVALTLVRLVMVEVGVFERICPRVERPETESAPAIVEVSDEEVAVKEPMLR